MIVGASRSFSGDDFGEIDHVGPAALVVAVHLDQVAGFELRLLAGVGGDDVAAADGFGVELMFLREIGADGVDMGAGRKPAAFDDGIGGGGRGYDDVEVADGLFRGGNCDDRNF